MTTVPAPGLHSVTVEGVTQHFRVSGNGPFCIAHAGGPGIDASYLLLPLLESQLTMVYLDPIGTGSSGCLPTHPRGYSVERFADQLLGFIDRAGIPDPYLLGHSHGAFVVLDAALKRPTGIAGLILYGGAAYTGGDFMAAASAGIDSFVARHEGTAEATSVQEAWASMPKVRDDEDYTAALRKLLPVYFSDFRRFADVLVTMQRQLRATMLLGDNQPFDVRDRLPTLPTPSLVLAGTDDFILGPRHAMILAERISNVRLEVFERSGHFAHIEEPQGFADAVLAFTRGPSRTSPVAA
jgi:pimeloyl-ACP methyl ester carboxylesterase